MNEIKINNPSINVDNIVRKFAKLLNDSRYENRNNYQNDSVYRFLENELGYNMDNGGVINFINKLDIEGLNLLDAYINKLTEKYTKIDEIKIKNDIFNLKPLVEEFVKELKPISWNLQESIVHLSKYMLDNKMNVSPLPKVIMVKNDKENASTILGKTAFYNPNDKTITLYTFGRHPKDILRSFSHEMIHHIQNLEGRLNNIQTTNTNEDDNLTQLEKEAYEKGNMTLRNWEDSIKKNKN